MKKMVIERTELIGLEKGVDYEIVTSFVIDDMDFIPSCRFLKNKNLNEFCVQKRGTGWVNFFSKIDGKVGWSIQETKPINDIHEAYRLKENMIDLETAVDCGFGIIRVLKGDYKGQYFLYYIDNDEEYFPLMLDVYLQIAVKDYDNKSLERYVSKKSVRTLLSVLQFGDDNALLHKLDMSFQSKKGGDNVVVLRRSKNEN